MGTEDTEKSNIASQRPKNAEAKKRREGAKSVRKTRRRKRKRSK